MVTKAIAVNQATNRVYVTTLSSLFIIDGATNTILTTNTMVGGSSVAVNPVTNRIYAVSTYKSGGSTLPGMYVINGVDNSIIGSPIPLKNTAYQVEVNPVTNRIYVTNDTDKSISVIDGNTNTLVDTITTDKVAYNIAINSQTNKIYVSSPMTNSLMVIDGAADTQTTSISLPYYPNEVGVNPNTNRVYVAANLNPGSDSSFNPGILYIVDGSNNTVLTNLPTQGLAGIGVGVNQATSLIYVSNFQSGDVSVISDPVAPVISSQPASQTIYKGQPASLSVTAQGTGPISYQWYEGTSGDISKPISGATGNGFVTPPLNAPKSYWVRVTNALGSADSNTAIISITLQVTQPTDNGLGDTPGTLSYSLSKATSGETIPFAANLTSVTFNSPSTSPLTLSSGVTLQGRCLAGKPDISINGNGRQGPLVLSGKNTLVGLKISGFSSSPQIKTTGGGNKLSCTRAAR